jgi:phosphate transport system permease protein
MTDTTAPNLSSDADEAPVLTHSWADRRALRNGMFTIGAWLVALIAAVPLVSVLYMLIVQGGSRLSTDLFTELPPAGFEMGGGFGNAIVGTVLMVVIATVIAVPIGVMAAAYLAELGPDSQLGRVSRFLAKVLTGFPSILAGVFVYAVLVLAMGTYSAIAGGVALSILMLPTVVLTRTQMIWKVVFPTALPGILTGVMLGVARVAGESAPLLFTALFSNYWISNLREPTASLSILIYNFSSMPFDNQIELAWAASLVLVLIVLVFNILSRLFGRAKY